jgi:hypothetical protein
VKVHLPPRLDEAIIEITASPKLSLKNLTVEFSGIVVSAGLYDFDAEEEEGAPPPLVDKVEDSVVPVPTGFSVRIKTESLGGGNEISYGLATWDFVDDEYLYELEWQATSGPDTDKYSVISTEDEDSLRTGYLVDGQEYQFRLRTWAGASPSEWTSYDPGGYIPATAQLDRKRIVAANSHYKAFPASVKLGSSIVLLYSDGTAHGDSDRQYMARTDDDGRSYSEVVFVENSAPTVFDYSLISDLMADGDIVVLKVYTIVKVNGTCWTYTNATVADYTNYLRYSDDHENAAWVKSVGISAFGSGSVANAAADFMGQQTMDRIMMTSEAGADSLQQTITGLSPNQTLTYTQVAKYETGGPTWIRLFIADADAASNYVAAYFNIQTGTLGTTLNAGNGSGVTSAITAMPDGRWALQVSGKPNTSGANTLSIARPLSSGSGSSYTGNGSTTSWLAGRSQVNIGASANFPLLKTTSAAVGTGVSSNTEAYWMMTKKIGSYWYRAGYSTVPSDGIAGLFRSEDGYGWTLLASFGAAGKDVNEFDFEKLDNGDFIAVFREDVTAGRQLYFALSTGGDNSWGALDAISQSVVAGTQPNLIKLADGRILLAVGDRTGVSGMSADGFPDLSNVNRTGVSVSIAPADIDAAGDFGQHVQVGLSYGTDCGQPATELTSDNKVWIGFYATEKLGVEPGIYSGVYTP